jgi:hypothetical protein
MVKPEMCHIRLTRSLSSDSFLPVDPLRPGARAQAAGDVRGGTGANFVADRGAGSEIAEPTVIGSVGSGHYAFIPRGRPIKIIGWN